MQECEDINAAPNQLLPPPRLGCGRAWENDMEQISIDLGLSKGYIKKEDEFYNPTPMFAIAARKTEAIHKILNNNKRKCA